MNDPVIEHFKGSLVSLRHSKNIVIKKIRAKEGDHEELMTRLAVIKAKIATYRQAIVVIRYYKSIENLPN